MVIYCFVYSIDVYHLLADVFKRINHLNQRQGNNLSDTKQEGKWMERKQENEDLQVPNQFLQNVASWACGTVSEEDTSGEGGQIIPRTFVSLFSLKREFIHEYQPFHTARPTPQVCCFPLGECFISTFYFGLAPTASGFLYLVQNTLQHFCS